MASAQPIRDLNSLPKELRDMIWDAAVRDDRPAAHFFSLSFDKNDDVDDDDGDYCFVFGFNDGPTRDRLTRDGQFFWGNKISAPKAGRKEKELFSWTANNPSTYLQDGGLWTACHESRAAIERSQKKRDWGVFTCPPEGTRHCNTVNSHKSMSGYFNNNGVRQYFAIGVNDLVCFQLVDFEEYLFVSDHTPFFTYPRWEPNFLQHLAFEFDSTWRCPDPAEKFFWDRDDFIGCIANAVIWEGIHIWFIDYGIQRDTSFSGNFDIRDNRHVFYGNACRYVEVQCSDPEWDYPRLEGSDLPGPATALYFAEQLDEGMKDYDRFEYYSVHLEESDCEFEMEIETRSGAILGVLACEYKW